MLVGPHTEGAQALLPPAVITRAPISSPQTHCDAGWRLGTSSKEDIELPHVAAAPISLELICLLDAVALVQEHAPGAPRLARKADRSSSSMCIRLAKQLCRRGRR